MSGSAPNYAAPYPVATASVKAITSTPGITIPVDFIGFSVECADLIGGYYQGTSGTWNGNASAASFISLVNLLGSKGVLRIGGNTSETSTTPALTQVIANNLATFVSALGAGWSVIYGLDLFANNSALAVTQAGYLNTALGAKVTFQMGQEPIQSGHFTIPTYITAWNAYYDAIIASIPGAKFSAWDESNWIDTQTAINGLTPGVSGLQEVTYHYYNGPGLPSVAFFLDNIRDNQIFFSRNNGWAGSTPQRVTESNSVSNGGSYGLSNSLISAAWYLNECIAFASIGYAGINTHMFFIASQPYYSPIHLNADQTFTPNPIFYGLYLMSKLQGQQIIPHTSSGPDVVFLSTLQSAGKSNILVLNNSIVNSASVRVEQDISWATATVLLLNGTGPYDQNPKIGGWPIGPSGAWQGGTFTISKGDRITLPPCGAALVSVQ